MVRYMAYSQEWNGLQKWLVFSVLDGKSILFSGAAFNVATLFVWNAIQWKTPVCKSKYINKSYAKYLLCGLCHFRLYVLICPPIHANLWRLVLFWNHSNLVINVHILRISCGKERIYPKYVYVCLFFKQVWL